MIPDPIALQFGPFALRWYGLLIVGGALLGAWISAREAQRRGENPDHAWDVLVLGLIMGILGGRLYHVISSPAGTQLGWRYYFVDHPFTTIQFGALSLPFPSALAIWEGGLGIYGGVLGGALAVWLYSRWHNLKVSRWLDIGAYGLITGQAVGRWGNFFNQELYGAPTSLPWGIPIDMAHRLPQYAELPATARFHPTFLYESLWNFMALALMLWIGRRFAHWLRDGDITLLYLILYPLGRFLAEFQRPDAWTMFGLPTAQWIALVLIIAAGTALWLRHRGPVPAEDRPFSPPAVEGRRARRGPRAAKVARERR